MGQLEWMHWGGGGCLAATASAGFPSVGEFGDKDDGRFQMTRLGFRRLQFFVTIKSRSIGNACSSLSPTDAESSPSGECETE